MARQVSKGRCTFCHRELSKSGVAKHLQSCEQRTAREAEAQGHQKAQQTTLFHLMVQGLYAPMYWMHLEVTAETTLATLDQFFRNIWLECCDHLSQFKIDNIRYCENPEMYASWSRSRQDMSVRLDEVLSPGQVCSYEYDFGSTTYLTLKVIAQREGVAKEKPIQILARNNLPPVPCDECGKPATYACTRCIYEEREDISVMYVARSTNAKARGSSHYPWSIHHELACVAIPARDLKRPILHISK